MAALAGFSSCALKREQAADVEEAADDDEEAEEKPAKAEEKPLTHPRQPTAWDTRVYVTTTSQPSQARIAQCFQDIDALANEAQSKSGMLSAQAQATAVVGKDLAVHHFCFYQMMAKLDERLEAGGPMMDDLATAFFDGMRRLWILARALDSHHGRPVYMPWLTRRYVQLSREYFGRTVEVVAPPMGKNSP